MGRRRSKKNMTECGEFFVFKSGRSMFNCAFCQENLEFDNFKLFISHMQFKHKGKLAVDSKIKSKDSKEKNCKENVSNSKNQKDECLDLPKENIRRRTAKKKHRVRKPIPKLKIRLNLLEPEIATSEIFHEEKEKLHGEAETTIETAISNQDSIDIKEEGIIYQYEVHSLKNDIEEEKKENCQETFIVKEEMYSDDEKGENADYQSGLFDDCRNDSDFDEETHNANNISNKVDIEDEYETKKRIDEDCNSENKNIIQNTEYLNKISMHNNVDYSNIYPNSTSFDNLKGINNQNEEQRISSIPNLKQESEDLPAYNSYNEPTNMLLLNEPVTEQSEHSNDMAYIDNFSVENIESNSEKKGPRKLYVCEKCGVKYKKESTLNRHRGSCGLLNGKRTKRPRGKPPSFPRKKNEQGLYECTMCDLEFPKFNEICKHEKSHRMEKLKQGKQCEVCGKYLNSITSLKMHLLRHTGDTPFKCAICSRGFYNKYTLATHEKIHNPEKEFQCDLCEKKYSRDVDLKRHVRYIHLNERPTPVICDLCGKSFTFAFNLKYHMRRHLNVKPVKCNQCDMTFVEKGDLNKHLITHNPDYKPFVCGICGKGFSRKITLTKHEKLHTGVKEYVCKICGKAFAQSPGLYMHMKSHGFNIKPEGAGYYERQSHLMFRNMSVDRTDLS